MKNEEDVTLWKGEDGSSLTIDGQGIVRVSAPVIYVRDFVDRTDAGVERR